MNGLKVKVIKGYLSLQMDYFSQNDAYVILQLGSQKHKTSVKVDSNTPEWNQVFSFSLQPAQTTLRVTVKDEDSLMNQIIGTANVDIRQFYNIRQPVQKYIKLESKERPAGKILLKFMPAYYNDNNLVQDQYILSNHNIDYYDAKKHHMCNFDLQRQGNLELKKKTPKANQYGQQNLLTSPFYQNQSHYVQPNYQNQYNPVQPQYLNYPQAQNPNQPVQYYSPQQGTSLIPDYSRPLGGSSPPRYQTNMGVANTRQTSPARSYNIGQQQLYYQNVVPSMVPLNYNSISQPYGNNQMSRYNFLERAHPVQYSNAPIQFQNVRNY